jgi:hypothetical protein
MTKSMHASLTAIGRRLHADYLPTLAKPLPSELKDLVAQLVALEFGKRGSTQRPVEVLQSAIAPLGPRSQSTRLSIGRQTDQTG